MSVTAVGKYKILERIGRGGMGTVYKGHDPILDRQVALKVISSDADVSEELKARFYREAQACAKLSHPNIVVVHDLGEDAGQLFIVMELLEGQELRFLIEQKTLSLDEKLSLMIQVCDGLHFAHQKGIIHRDIKPGNIFVLRNGQVKILDFGIARITSGSDPGLTRTGFLMGTLRYMSPEQARGKVDQRSDIFSVGAVFYELLAGRPAFDSADPLEILERIRSENPVPLTEVDPAIPPELAAIVERALRKDPGQRFPDLGQMRAQIEAVRRGTGDEGIRVAAQVRGQMERLLSLQTELGKLTGQGSEDETMPLVTASAPTAELHAQAQQLTGRIEEVEARVQQAQALEPAVVQALELLAAGDAAAAGAELERVVREIPEHARAQEALRRARSAATRAPGPASPALTRAPTPGPSTAAPAATRIETPRPPVRPAATPRPAPAAAAVFVEPAAPARPRTGGQWRLALAGVAGVVVIGIGTYAVYGPARAPLEPTSVVSPTPSASTSTSTATPPERAAAEALRVTVQAARESAAKVEAERLARTPWAAAVAREREADAALGQQEYAKAQAAYRDAEQAYGRAAAEAQQAMVAAARELDARRVQERSAEARRTAEAADAAKLVGPLWARATGVERDAESALKRQEFERAQALWQDAEQAYRQAATEAGQKASAAERERQAVAQRELQAAEQVREEMARARTQAEKREAPRLAAKLWAEASAKESDAREALGRREYGIAQLRFREAEQVYQRAAQEARTAAEQLLTAAVQAEEATKLRQEVDRQRTLATGARERALRTGADRLARELYESARARETEAASLEGQQQFAAARQAYQDAAQRFGEALSRAQVARVAKSEADQARARMLADKQKARSDAADFRAAVAEEQQGDASYERTAFSEATGHFRNAQALFARAGSATDARPVAADPRSEIRSVLDSYKRALEEKDAALLRRVRPGLGAEELRRLGQTRSHKLDLTIESIDVNGDQAEARGRRADAVVAQDGRSFRNEAPVVFKLRRTPSGWVIDAVN
jgi:hypothetical protein